MQKKSHEELEEIGFVYIKAAVETVETSVKQNCARKSFIKGFRKAIFALVNTNFGIARRAVGTKLLIKK